jgi:hypothetical protein
LQSLAIFGRQGVLPVIKRETAITEREVDVSGQKQSWNEVRIIECKAESGDKPLSGQYVRKFFTETVPAFLKIKCPSNNPSVCHAEIWTTGTVTNEALGALNEIKLGKYIKPALVGKTQLIDSLPKTLGSIKRLIETIAELGNTNQDRHQFNSDSTIPLK